MSIVTFVCLPRGDLTVVLVDFIDMPSMLCCIADTHVRAFGDLGQRERAVVFALRDANLRAAALRRVGDRRAADRLALRRDLAGDRAVALQRQRDRGRILGAGRVSRARVERPRVGWSAITFVAFFGDADERELAVLIGDVACARRTSPRSSPSDPRRLASRTACRRSSPSRRAPAAPLASTTLPTSLRPRTSVIVPTSVVLPGLTSTSRWMNVGELGAADVRSYLPGVTSLSLNVPSGAGRRARLIAELHGRELRRVAAFDHELADDAAAARPA